MPADTEEDPSSFLAATGPLEQDLDLSTSDQDAAQAVSDGLRDAKAPNTRRAYASAWHTFLEWTILTGRESMPAAPQSVALYLGHLAAEGKSLATINQARAAISHAHAAAGISQNENPARHPVVAEMVKGWRNTSPAPAQVDALTALALARIRETARLPRRGRGGTDGITRDRPAAGHPGPGRHRSPGRRRAETLRGLGTDLEGRGTVAGRYGADNPAEGQEPAGATDGSGNNSHRPVPPGDPTGEHRPLSSGVRSDRRDPGQPGPCCRQRRRPGRGLQRT